MQSSPSGRVLGHEALGSVPEIEGASPVHVPVPVPVPEMARQGPDGRDRGHEEPSGTGTGTCTGKNLIQGHALVLAAVLYVSRGSVLEPTQTRKLQSRKRLRPFWRLMFVCPSAYRRENVRSGLGGRNAIGADFDWAKEPSEKR